MSFVAMNWAGNLTIGNSTHKTVLRELAAYANRNNIAFPSAKTLAKKCELSVRTVFRCLKYLSQKGFIKKVDAGTNIPENYNKGQNCYLLPVSEEHTMDKKPDTEQAPEKPSRCTLDVPIISNFEEKSNSKLQENSTYDSVTPHDSVSYPPYDRVSHKYIKNKINNINIKKEKYKKEKKADESEAMSMAQASNTESSPFVQKTNDKASKSKSSKQPPEQPQEEIFDWRPHVDPSLHELFEGLLKVRIRLKVENTNLAIKRIVKRLNKNTLEVQEELLDNAVMNEWRTIYIPKKFPFFGQKSIKAQKREESERKVQGSEMSYDDRDMMEQARNLFGKDFSVEDM